MPKVSETDRVEIRRVLAAIDSIGRWVVTREDTVYTALQRVLNACEHEQQDTTDMVQRAAVNVLVEEAEQASLLLSGTENLHQAHVLSMAALRVRQGLKA